MLLPQTLTVPELPEEIYPAVTVGETLELALHVAVTSPVSLMVIVGFAVMLVAGVCALPA